MADFDNELLELDVDEAELSAEDTVAVTEDIDAWIQEMLSGPEEEDDYPY